MPQGARLSEGGGGDCYLGNARIDPATFYVGLPLSATLVDMKFAIYDGFCFTIIVLNTLPDFMEGKIDFCLHLSLCHSEAWQNVTILIYWVSNFEIIICLRTWSATWSADMTLAIYDGFCFMIVPLPEVCAKHATITFSRAPVGGSGGLRCEGLVH